MNTTAQKGISLVIFFLTTMLAGSVPILLFSQCQGRMSSGRGQTIISLLNCFAGGVFLATCLLNLLVEGFEEYEDYRELSGFDSEYPFFHLAIAVGFFSVAFVERFAIVFSKDRSKNSRHDAENPEEVGTENIGLDNDTLELTSKDTARNSSNGNPQSLDSPPSPPPGSAISASDSNYTSTSLNSSCGHPERSQGRRRASCTEVTTTERFTGHSGVVAITIFLALSFHTIFDGLAVGLQETAGDIWTMTVAISIHKTIVAVSLGLELARSFSSPSSPPGKPLLFLFVFALMAPVGVAIGMGVTSGHVDERAHLLAGSILQGVATGSFLYVTFFEVLGEELGHRSSVLKIVMTLAGFGAMAVAKIWDAD